MEKTRIIIDTDPGIDDTVALFAALHAPALEVALITTVSGNVPVARTTENVLRLLTFMGKRVPVAVGCAAPLVAPPVYAADVHGETGLGGCDLPPPADDCRPLALHAVEAMRRTLETSDVPVTLVPIGPLTNVALLLTLYPDCKEKLARIVLMGGSTARGNLTPMAEFNIAVDPEAAHIVFASGVELVMCGLDVTTRALLTAGGVEQLRRHNRTGAAIAGMFAHYRGGSRRTGFEMHDACAVAYLLRPALFVTRPARVQVELRGAYTRGCTVVNFDGAPNARVCTEVDAAAFERWLIDALTPCV